MVLGWEVLLESWLLLFIISFRRLNINREVIILLLLRWELLVILRRKLLLLLLLIELLLLLLRVSSSYLNINIDRVIRVHVNSLLLKLLRKIILLLLTSSSISLTSKGRLKPISGVSLLKVGSILH